MKTQIIYFIFLLTLFGCKKDDPIQSAPKELPFRLDYQSGFNGKYVQDKIDGIEHGGGYMMTDGLASQLQTSLLEGKHILSISVVTDSVSADTTFTLKDNGLWIGTNYNRLEKKLTFTFSNSPFVY
jgi:hypothetical protein